MNTENIFCTKCGSKQQGNVFCSKCGNKLTGNELKKETENEIFDTRRPVKENKVDDAVNKDQPNDLNKKPNTKFGFIFFSLLLVWIIIMSFVWIEISPGMGAMPTFIFWVLGGTIGGSVIKFISNDSSHLSWIILILFCIIFISLATQK